MRRKILVGIGLFLCALLLSAWLVLRSQWLRETLKAWAIARLERAVEAEVEVERLGGSLIFDLILEGVTVVPKGSGEPILQFDRGEMGYNPLKLLGDDKEIEYLEVWYPLINLSKNGGKWNFQALFPPKHASTGNPDKGDDPVSIKHIAIIGGELNLRGVRHFDQLRGANLFGSLSLKGAETTAEVKGGTGELPGRVRVRKVTGRINIREGAVSLETVRLLTKGSSLFFNGTIADSLAIELSQSQLSLPELDRYLSLGGLLEGRAEGTVRLTREEGHLHVVGEVGVPEGRFGEYEVEQLALSLLLQDRVLDLEVKRGRVGGGELRGRATFDLDRGSFRAQGEGARIDLGRLPLDLPRRLRSDLNGRFRIRSQDLRWNRPCLEGVVSLSRSSLGGVEIDSLALGFRSGPGWFEFDSLGVATGQGTISVTGRLSSEAVDLALKSADIELSTLGPLFGLSNLEGGFSSDLLVQGDPSAPSLFGTFWVMDGALGGVRFECLSGNLNLDRVGRESLGRADLHFVEGEMLARRWESGDLTFNADGKVFSYLLQIGGEEVTVELEGRGETRPDDLLLQVTRLLLKLEDQKVENREEIELVVKDTELLISKAEFNWPGGSITLSGRMSPSGESDLSLSGNRVSLRETCLLFGLKRDLRGEINFRLDGQGRISDPKMSLTLTGQNIAYQTGIWDTLSLELSYEAKTLQINRMIMWREGVKSDVTGSLPLDLSLVGRGRLLTEGRISLTAILNNTGVWVFFPFRQFVEVSSGKVDANLRVSGTWQSPSLAGELSLNSGKMLVRFLGTRLSAVNSHVILKKDSLLVASFSGVTDQGEVRARGALLFDGLRPRLMDFTFNATGVRVTQIEDVTALVDADLRVHGGLEEPLFAGEVRVTEAMIAMPFKERKVGAAALRSRFALDLAVIGERDIWLRNDNADLELEADLRVSRTEGKVLVSGALNTKRGYLYPPHLEVPFRITKGEFQFTKSLELDPILDLKAETQVIYHPATEEGSPSPPESVLVKLDVTGTMRQPEFKFYSLPPLPLEDIIALLTTGTTRQELASLGAVGRGGERFASYWFRHRVLRQLQETMPIDALDMRTQIWGEEEERKAELTVGKYVSKDLYVSYTQDLFSRSKNQFKGEYHLWKGAALVGERDEEDKYNLGVQFKFRY